MTVLFVGLFVYIPLKLPTPFATMQQLVSPVNCDVIPHLDWFNWGPSCVANVVEKQCVFLHTLLLFLSLCNEPHCHSFSLQS